jgi:hypothetical protein
LPMAVVLPTQRSENQTHQESVCVVRSPACAWARLLRSRRAFAGERSNRAVSLSAS